MGYPFICAYKTIEFARVNHDGLWSVDWAKTINFRFELMTPRNAAVVAMAIVLMAAKDNFWETPWKISDDSHDKWPHKSQTLDIEESEPDVNSIRANYGLSSSGVSVARVNYDGTWAVNWPAVTELARESLANYKTTAVIAFCQMLMAGQYRFTTTPWIEVKRDDDD
jgi:hypothetical protein